MIPPVKSIRTICDSCTVLIEIPTATLVPLSQDIMYEGIICPNCDNILVIDSTILRIAKPKRSHTKKGSRKKPVKKKWKIIEKGKLPVDEDSPRRPSTSRKAKKTIQR